MYKIIFNESYIKRAEKFARKHLEVLKQYEETLNLLEVNPFHPSLRLHKLEDGLFDFYSASINMNYRITIEFIIKENELIPITVGKHEDVF